MRTFRFWSMKAADSLTEPLAMPAVYFSCFGTGTEFGDSGPLMSSATCFSELWELFCFRQQVRNHKVSLFWDKFWYN